jgi:hypothetical protein
MFNGYTCYQAERAKTQAEQREADAQLGQLFAALAQLLGSLAKPVRALRRQSGTESPAGEHARHPVGFQKSAAGPDLGFYAVRSYSLTRVINVGGHDGLGVRPDGCGDNVAVTVVR